MLTIQEIADHVAEASQNFPVSKVELFGSYARGTSTPESDVDLLVSFTKPRISLLTLNAMKYQLEELLGTQVDLVHSPLPEGSVLEIDRRIPLYGV